MKISFMFHEDDCTAEQLLDSQEFEAYHPHLGSSHIKLRDTSKECPKCSDNQLEISGFTGKDSVTTSHSGTFIAAGCKICRAHLGTIKIHGVESLFGEDEDLRILRGPWKIF